MLDANLLFANVADINANTNSNIFDLGPSPADGEWHKFAVSGAVSGTTPTLTVTVQASDSATFASGVRAAGSFPVFNAQGQAAEIAVHCPERYRRYNYVVSGGTPVFNDCTGGVCSGPERDAES